MTNDGTNAVIAPVRFVSNLLTIPTGAACITSNLAHGLALTNPPVFVRWVLVCQFNHAGYVTNDEVDINAVLWTDGYNPFTWGASTNTVFLSKRGTLSDVRSKVTGLNVATDETYWKAKCYAAP